MNSSNCRHTYLLPLNTVCFELHVMASQLAVVESHTLYAWIFWSIRKSMWPKEEILLFNFRHMFIHFDCFFLTISKLKKINRFNFLLTTFLPLHSVCWKRLRSWNIQQSSKLNKSNREEDDFCMCKVRTDMQLTLTNSGSPFSSTLKESIRKQIIRFQFVL